MFELTLECGIEAVSHIYSCAYILFITGIHVYVLYDPDSFDGQASNHRYLSRMEGNNPEIT